ncbi:unnamed protein product [Durusdinium trenchii]|uniref:Uncharacterized protein n=1 Tax=Durusdinium trenchii TaxID=1381693 RepID=A0ABP0KW61_9DINO
MGKVKKTHLKNKKAKAKAQGKKTEADGDEVLDAGETSHELKRRHAAERKALQAKIVELKRQRKKLPKKKNKDDKKALTEEMKKLKNELRQRHDDELQKAGVQVEEDRDFEEDKYIRISDIQIE